MIISNINSNYYLLTTTTTTTFAFISLIIFVLVIIIFLIKCTFCERHKATTTTTTTSGSYSEKNNVESPYYNIDSIVENGGGVKSSKIDGNNNVNVRSSMPNHHRSSTTNNDDNSHYLKIDDDEDEDDVSEENMANGGDGLYESPLEIDEKISKNKLDKKSSSKYINRTQHDDDVDGRRGETIYFEDDNDKSLYSAVVKRDKNNNDNNTSNVSSSKMSKISENIDEQPYIPRKKFNVQEETIRCSMNLDKQQQQQQPRSPSSSKPPSTTIITTPVKPSFKHQPSEGSGHYDVLPDYEVISDIRKDSRTLITTSSSINDNSPNHSVQEATIVLNDGDDNYYSNIENYTSAPLPPQASNRNNNNNNNTDNDKHTIHIRSSVVVVDNRNSRYSSNSGQYSDINHMTETVNTTTATSGIITNSPRHELASQTINKSPLNDLQQTPSLYDSIRF